MPRQVERQECKQVIRVNNVLKVKVKVPLTALILELPISKLIGHGLPNFKAIDNTGVKLSTSLTALPMYWQGTLAVLALNSHVVYCNGVAIYKVIDSISIFIAKGIGYI